MVFNEGKTPYLCLIRLKNGVIDLAEWSEKTSSYRLFGTNDDVFEDDVLDSRGVNSRNEADRLVTILAIKESIEYTIHLYKILIKENENEESSLGELLGIKKMESIVKRIVHKIFREDKETN